MHYGANQDYGHLEGLRAESLAAYQETVAARDREHIALAKAIGEDSAAWQTKEDRLLKARDDYNSKFAALNRPTDAKPISKFILIFVFLICVAGEATVNKYMFDMLLRTSNLFSYSYSLLITAVLLVIAHVAGHQTRQIYGSFEAKFYPAKAFGILLCFIMMTVIVGVLTVERAHYSVLGLSGLGASLSTTGGDIFSQVTGHLSKQIESLGWLGTILAALADREAMMLAVINCAGIVFAFLISFVTHDSDKTYQSTLDEYARCQKKFDRMAGVEEKASNKISRRYSPRLAAHASAYGARNARVIEAKRNQNLPITDEDRVDISTFDTKLVKSRKRMSNRIKQATASISPDLNAPNDNLLIATPISFDRRA